MNPDAPGWIFRVLSACLSYPEPETQAVLAEAVAEIGDESVRRRLSGFVRELAAEPLLVRQERYTETFDLSPSCCLNLTAHGVSPGEERGLALCGLLALYRRCGWEPAGGELPDFLPLLLEFLSLVPEAAADREIASLGGAVAELQAALCQRGSPYAVPLEILCAVFPRSPVPPGAKARQERDTP